MPVLEYGNMWKELFAAGTTAFALSACGGGKAENSPVPPTPIKQAISQVISSPDFLNNPPADSVVSGPARPALVFGENVDCAKDKFPRAEIKPVNNNSTLRVLNTEVDLKRMLKDTIFRGPQSIISFDESKIEFKVSTQDLAAILAIVHKDRSNYVVTANYICPTWPYFK